ncbi:MAG: hypothetical protein IPG81_27575 [Sandaracinaceae bacterium]|nr:hypothetical protein [Sandaracinaceae bacterium]
MPATWGVVVLARDAHGTMAFALDVGLAGTPIVAEALLPSRVRVGEPLTVPMHVTNTSAADATYGLSASAGDALSATLPATVTVPAGESRELALLLNGRTPGDATLRVQVTRDGQPQRSLEATVAVDRGRHPIRRWGTGIARGDEYSVSLQVPRDAVDPRTRVVLLTPGALAADPLFSEVRERQPGAMAWAAVSAGRGCRPSCAPPWCDKTRSPCRWPSTLRAWWRSPAWWRSTPRTARRSRRCVARSRS